MREGSGLPKTGSSGPAGGPVPPSGGHSTGVRGPAGGPVPKQTPSPRPAPRPLARPGQDRSGDSRTQPRRYPKPTHHDDDAIASVGRVVLRRAFPIIAGLVTPETLNQGEEEWLEWKRQRDRMMIDPPPLPAIVEHPDGTIDVHPSNETWWPRPVPVLYPPANPDAEPQEVPHGVPSSPRPRPRPVPIDDPLFRPSSVPGRQIRDRERPLGELQIQIKAGEDGQPIVRIRPKAVNERWIATPRWRDDKFGRKVFWVVNKVVDATYGVVSEAQDLVEVFTHSLYGPDGVPALDLYGSQAGAVRAYMEGKVKLDAVGFVIDFGINQASDLAYGLADAPMEYAQKKSAYWAPQYTAHRFRLDAGQREEWNDYVQSWVQPAQKLVRSWDSARAERIRGLWSS